MTLALLLAGALMLALAAGRPIWNRSDKPRIAVMVDVSPSTRGASWFDRAWRAERISELVGSNDFQFYEFSSAEYVYPTVPERPSSETPVERTDFLPPPDAQAIVLFSDARFELPVTAPPTYVVVDPVLENPSDGAVLRLSASDSSDFTMVARNQLANDPTEKPRQLDVRGVLPSSQLPLGETLAHGTFTYHARPDPRANSVSAQIVGGDRWPENDSLTISIPRPQSDARWWIASDSSGSPDTTWTQLRPSELPNDAAAYLAPSIVVLDDVAADALPLASQQRLVQYVRELGGTLVFIGGEHAFGAGGYGGTLIDELSPLSSTPPTPRTHWILLVDSSGSMATNSRWASAVGALLRTLPAIPANDPISVGSFADSMRWWSVAKPLRETLAMQFPPSDVTPRGPTNLQPALDQIASNTTTQLAAEVLILSDGDATIDQPGALAEKLRKLRVRVHLLLTGPIAPQQSAAGELATMTGGTVVRESDPGRWSQQLRELLRRASPDAIIRTPTTVRFDSSTGLASRQVQFFNSVWPRANSQALALGDGTMTLAAKQNIGLGTIVSLAFGATAQEVTAIDKLFARRPRDPRFSIAWDCGSTLRLTIDAINPDGSYLNGLNLMLVLSNDAGDASQTVPITQRAPGRYELAVQAPRIAKIATIQFNDAVIDRAFLAGHYPPEFDAVGNDRLAMNRLAERTGGRVIEPSDHASIDFPRHRRSVPVGSELAFVGSALIAIGLIQWRRSA